MTASLLSPDDQRDCNEGVLKTVVSAIAGYRNFNERVSPSKACADQLDALRALGDDPCFWAENRVALGRRIFPSVPEDTYDLGPEVRGDGAFVLVADARIDNRRELAEALHIARSHMDRLSDCALLLECLLAWKLGALNRIVGDFAFAFWDRERAILTLARDYLGQRPLYYTSAPGYFAFASMPRGLHALSAIPRRPCRAAAARYLLELPQPPAESFFKGVMQVPAGNVLTLRSGTAEVRRWWNFNPPPRRHHNLDECAQQARELLDRAVAQRLRGGGELIASHLSAGLDSSGVIATAARLLRPQNRRLLAYTAVPQAAALDVPSGVIADESELATLVAGQFDNIEHIKLGGAGSLSSVFERNVELWERVVPNPFNDLWWSSIAQDAATRGTSVLLSAPMGNIGLSHSGNEIFSELLSSFRWCTLARTISDHRRGGEHLARIAFTTLSPFLPKPVWNLVQHLRGRSGMPDFLQDAARLPWAGVSNNLKRAPRSTFKRRVGLIAITNPGAFNAGAVAGWRVDIRDATADRRLMEFTLGLPTDMFFSGGQNRVLARQALADRLPAAVLHERRKGYQAADWYLILLQNREELIAEVEAIALSPASEIVDSAAILSALNQLPQQRWSSCRAQYVYRNSLIRAVALGHFLRSAPAKRGNPAVRARRIP